MVKISFQPAVAGIKADKADKASTAGPAPAAEILLTPAQEERPPPQRYRKGGSVGGVCYLSMGMVVLLMGLVFASVYIYRYFFLVQLARDNFFHCGVLYEDSLSSQVRTRMELEEDVKIYLEENYERINVPVPQFGGGDPADIIHDFQRGLTAYHDISLDKCYVIELNTTIVLPPRNFWELLMNVKVSSTPHGILLLPPRGRQAWGKGGSCVGGVAVSWAQHPRLVLRPPSSFSHIQVSAPPFFFKILFIYSTEIETASERGNTSRESGRGRSRLPAEESDVGLDPITPGSCPELKADT
uniref:Integral membrane protein 2 n=1 Tax=Ailuropoda melanoleuca TaxID=9646 RepID=A0A7N5KLD8_AILME